MDVLGVIKIVFSRRVSRSSTRDGIFEVEISSLVKRISEIFSKRSFQVREMRTKMLLNVSGCKGNEENEFSTDEVEVEGKNTKLKNKGKRRKASTRREIRLSLFLSFYVEKLKISKGN